MRAILWMLRAVVCMLRAILWMLVSILFKVLEERMEGERRDFFAAHLQWKSDLADFERSYWPSKSFEIQLQWMQDNVLTKPQVNK